MTEAILQLELEPQAMVEGWNQNKNFVHNISMLHDPCHCSAKQLDIDIDRC